MSLYLTLNTAKSLKKPKISYVDELLVNHSWIVSELADVFDGQNVKLFTLSKDTLPTKIAPENRPSPQKSNTMN